MTNAWKSWNIRDQTTKALEKMLKQKYKEIDSNYKMLKKISSNEEANKLINVIWLMKKLANNIEFA